MAAGISLLNVAAHGDVPAPATFAIVIGVNKAVDPELAPLRYADDDAARYQDLFRALGARTYLLATLDDNTRQLHPQAAGEAVAPTQAGLTRMIARVREDVANAHSQGVPTALYFVYAGHGNAADGEGYLALEDTRLTGRRIASEILGAIGARENHLIIDACYSYFLVFGRGPSQGSRRSLRGFVPFEQVLSDEHTGLLLSTSSARESHEWDAYQAGIFSHEVRSGLFGAADADGDGRVSYREIAAFVKRANEAIPNDRFRPDVFARPPRDTPVLLNLREGQKRRLELDGARHGHFLLEDARGVRLADFHNAAGMPLSILRPLSSGPLFLRHVADGAEWLLEGAAEVLTLDTLVEREVSTQFRGAAHESFGRIFALPFDPEAVAAYTFRPIEPPRIWLGWSPTRLKRVVGGSTLMGVGLLTAGAGLALSLHARDIRDSAPQSASNASIIETNGRIDSLTKGAAALYGLSGAFVLAGALLFSWPDAKPTR